MSQNRFYQNAAITPTEGGFHILLDGRKLSTPKRKPFIMPNAATAQIIADEWNAQPKVLDPNLMPITRLINVAIDNAGDNRAEMVAEIRNYAATDLLCYMVSAPAPIAAEQKELWQPILDWAKSEHGLEFVVLIDSLDVAQHDETLDNIAAIATEMDDLHLTILTFMTQVLGSAILAFALVKGFINAASAFKAIRIEEDHNAKIWGYDGEDIQKSTLKQKDIDAVAHLLQCL